ncbi:MAG TPA: VOC family protein [Flavobacterium sp.]|jgi:PhnB protein|nr:VOC family protein [Flavobacterium sp.]
MKIPSHYLPVMPYLIVNDAEAFLTMAVEVFGAKEQYLSRLDNGTIRHGELRLHDAVIMFSQANENFSAKPAGMFLYVENVDKVYEKGLQHGGISLVSPMTQEYGYTAGFEDPYGNQWWIVEGASS